MESSLSVKYSDLVAETGLFLGYGRGADFGDTAWSTSQTANVESCVRSGVRQFYFPPPLDGTTYDWSFLKPTLTLDFLQGNQTVALPDDFGGLEGQITLSTADDSVSWPVDVTNEGKVRQYYTLAPNETGRPLRAAIQPLKGTGTARSSRSQLYLFPEADDDYVIRFQYYILPDCLDGSRPYAYGGAAHAETILESCLAIAEQRLDDTSSVHSEKFMERLAASIGLDRRNRPQTLGYNGDRSDGYLDSRYRRGLYESRVTFDGTQY